MAMKETPAMPLPPVPPPLGSSINAPLLIVDEEQRDTVKSESIFNAESTTKSTEYPYDHGKKETLERNIVEAMELIGKLKQCLNAVKQDEVVLKHKKQKSVAAYEIVHREVEKLCTQAEAVREIDQRENAALDGIVSVTHRLKSDAQEAPPAVGNKLVAELWEEITA
ncbi:hypothetical protein RND71_016747 [Anisodus tanguticus]|uniref:Uncharacterized protein n=1 Tax=Anisodus tanguticus TaxID=243964 RepID=A0AAE1S932_9SOLA|nr:hypothetical protein RND71_016747 [Anisodus tanguticus]